jgi:hypothetical protein
MFIFPRKETHLAFGRHTAFDRARILAVPPREATPYLDAQCADATGL